MNDVSKKAEPGRRRDSIAEEAAEIKAMRAETQPTRRATVPALEAVLYEPIPVLDSGFVRVVDYLGDDTAIVQAARVSYGRGTKKVSDDRGLIRYLMRHRHTTPFEMCELKLHVKLPIFVARQWIRHRTANVNEYSARYSVLDREFYVPERMAAQSETNRQGRAGELDPTESDAARALIQGDGDRAYGTYLDLLNETEGGEVRDPSRKGVARELARMVLPANVYTQWYWKVDLHNLLHFLSLRADPHAQYEIRVYAEAIGAVVQKWVPITWEAFEDYWTKGARLSAQALRLLKTMLAPGVLADEAKLEALRKESGLSQREFLEFLDTLKRGE